MQTFSIQNHVQPCKTLLVLSRSKEKLFDKTGCQCNPPTLVSSAAMKVHSPSASAHCNTKQETKQCNCIIPFRIKNNLKFKSDVGNFFPLTFNTIISKQGRQRHQNNEVRYLNYL